MKLRLVFLLLLFPGLAVPCNSTEYLLVPAVIGDGSGLVNLSIRLIPGPGDVFLSTFPQTGTSTQVSVEDATGFAFSKSNTSTCDAVVKIDTRGSAGYVDGPSAGAAVSVLAYSSAVGIPPRRDAVITGSVDALGNIGSVGGLYEKAIAAQASKARYFIIPKSSFLDILLLKGVKESHGIEVLEAHDAMDLIGFMIYNESLPEAGFERESEKLADIPDYESPGLGRFRNITLEIISLSNRTVMAIPQKNKETMAIRGFFENETQNHWQVMEKGYLFTAANGAFLDYIEVSTISAVIDGYADLEGKKDSVQACLDAVPEPEKTDSGFEWAISSDLRKAWAALKLNSTDTEEPSLAEEEFVAYNELMFADAWCIISKSLAHEANDSGKTINESAWQGLAMEMIDEMESMEHISQSSMDHYESALFLYDEGKYGASIYDSVYVIQMENAGADMYGMSALELDSEAKSLLEEERFSLWGRIYQTQGAYLANTNATGSALRILYLAKGIDNATLKMRELSKPAEDEAESPRGPEDYAIFLTIFLIIFMLLFYMTTRTARR